MAIKQHSEPRSIGIVLKRIRIDFMLKIVQVFHIWNSSSGWMTTQSAAKDVFISK